MYGSSMLHRHARGRQQLPLTYDHSRDYAGYAYSKTYKPKKARSLLSRMVLYSVAAVVVSGAGVAGGGGA